MHIAFVMVYGYFGVNILRTNISMAMVCMVNSTDALFDRLASTPANNSQDQCRHESLIIHDTYNASSFDRQYWHSMMRKVHCGIY